MAFLAKLRVAVNDHITHVATRHIRVPVCHSANECYIPHYRSIVVPGHQHESTLTFPGNETILLGT